MSRYADAFGFIRHRPTSTVHVRRLPETSASERTGSDLSFGEALLAMATARTPMVCGRRLRVDWTESSSGRSVPEGDGFDASDLCRGCMRVLGDESVEVFEQFPNLRVAEGP